ncbi:MAG: AMP-binding protein [Gammaproteobacteria bacterium]|nr:AMP-binding protein [Gammaproteobacteria bacterium]MBU2678364.1 AMP-binding protein [Gammaproteobacteria bacterium]NNC57368.1 AMP-binding protein [Woeseiaceae bacterium]NNL52099.1 AMP-binding protein [Woeseiaceae bacterium]
MILEKVWLKSYPEGVPAEVPTAPFRSIRELFAHGFSEYPDNPAYTNMGRTLSYRDLDQLSMRFACYLQQTIGLTRGERVAIMLPNILQYPVVMCGAFRAGLVVVNVNPMYTARELKHQLKDSGARCIVILENFAKVLEEVVADTDVEHVVTTGVGDLLGWPKSTLTNFVLRHVKKQVPAYNLANSVSFKGALRAGANKTLQPVDIGFADIAYLQYTGGTTGVSKGAMLSHRNMVYNVQQTIVWQGDAYEDVHPIIAITALPLYHIFSLQGNCLTVMAQGGHNILITNPRDFEGFAKEIAKYPFNMFTGVNTMFSALLNTPSCKDIDFSHLRVCIGGGTAVQPAVAKDWKKVTGGTILQGYGLTETSPAAIVCPVDSEFTGTIGLPIPSTDVIITDDDGKPLPAGQIGEICIKGPQVMEGYWQRPAETAEVMLPGGWLKTGDIGRMDDDGYFYIEDRKKDMILVSGFNVYPNEIENIVVELDGVLEAAAIGVPDERSGEIVKVFVVRKDDSLCEKDVLDHCRKNLTGYKRPKLVEFRDELPKTNVGKILRRELRD